MLANTDAKPRPCSNPNRQTITNRQRASFVANRLSIATYTIESAINGSTMLIGKLIMPIIDIPRVSECANVKPVTCSSSGRQRKPQPETPQQAKPAKSQRKPQPEKPQPEPAQSEGLDFVFSGTQGRRTLNLLLETKWIGIQ